MKHSNLKRNKSFKILRWVTQKNISCNVFCLVSKEGLIICFRHSALSRKIFISGNGIKQVWRNVNLFIIFSNCLNKPTVQIYCFVRLILKNVFILIFNLLVFFIWFKFMFYRGFQVYIFTHLGRRSINTSWRRRPRIHSTNNYWKKWAKVSFCKGSRSHSMINSIEASMEDFGFFNFSSWSTSLRQTFPLIPNSEFFPR